MGTAETADIAPSVDIGTMQAVLREHPVRLAVRFSSLATGTVHSGTDIDLAIEFDAASPADPGYDERASV